jgi:hypothetical protein
MNVQYLFFSPHRIFHIWAHIEEAHVKCLNSSNSARIGVPVVATINITVFWDVTPYSPADTYTRLRRDCYLLNYESRLHDVTYQTSVTFFQVCFNQLLIGSLMTYTLSTYVGYYKYFVNLIQFRIINWIYCHSMRDSSVSIATGYGLDGRGFDPRQGQLIFLYSTASEPALVPFKPPIERVSADLFPGLQRPGREDDHSPPSSAAAKNGGTILHSPIHLHGVMLKELSTETTLPSSLYCQNMHYLFS